MIGDLQPVYKVSATIPISNELLQDRWPRKGSRAAIVDPDGRWHTLDMRRYIAVSLFYSPAWAEWDRGGFDVELFPRYAKAAQQAKRVKAVWHETGWRIREACSVLRHGQADEDDRDTW